MQSSNKENVQLLILKCLSRRIKHIVISPGSRNAPLVIGFKNHKSFQTHVIHDERCAGFYALGLIQMLNEPVIVCCTSGSAVTNYYPAVAEAFYRNLPLFVVSADRPEELINQGDGQTINQFNVFGRNIVKSMQLNDFANDEKVKLKFETELDVLMNSLKTGPCHLNISFEEPLYLKVNKEIYSSDFVTNENFFEQEFDLDKLNTFSFQDKLMIIIGQISPNSNLINQIQLISNFSNVVVLAENTSNVNGENIIFCIDRVLQTMPSHIKNYQPKTLIHIGGPIVSKRIKQFLREIPELDVIRISKYGNFEDTFQNLKESIAMEEAAFLKIVIDRFKEKNQSNFKDKWKQLDLISRDKNELFAHENKGLNDWYIHFIFNQYIPENSIVHMANSSIIRYMQLSDPVVSCTYFSNRGTSGIEGSLSTAIGSATTNSSESHYLIIGDTSFIYDSNALWIRPFPKNLKVIVINNQGGGIFRLIEGAKDSVELEDFFEAKHSQSCNSLINAFGFECLQCNHENLDETMQHFLSHSCYDQFLEINTDAKNNPSVLTSYNNFLSSC